MYIHNNIYIYITYIHTYIYVYEDDAHVRGPCSWAQVMTASRDVFGIALLKEDGEVIDASNSMIRMLGV